MTVIDKNVPQGAVVSIGVESHDIPRLVYTAPYFVEAPVAELIAPSVQESVEGMLPSLVPPYVQDAANTAVSQLAVLLAGSTMTGPLYLSPMMPTAPSQAASMAYVDAMLASGGIPDVPPSPPGQSWARESGQWVPVLDAGPDGTIMANLTGSTNPPTMQGISAVLDYEMGNGVGALALRGLADWTTLPNSPGGAVLVTNASGPVWLPPATAAGRVLTSNGPGTDVGWAQSALSEGPDGSVMANITGNINAPSLQSFSGVMDHVMGSSVGGLALRGLGGWTNFASVAQGAVLTTNASGPVWLPAASSAGQVLVSGGPGANPAWGAAGAGSGTITGVTAGPGLAGGGTTGSVTLQTAAGPDKSVMANMTGTDGVSLTPQSFSGVMDHTMGSTVGGLGLRGVGGWTNLTPAAQGSVLCMFSGPSWLTPGAAGQVLTSNGTGANPSWTTPSTGSGAVNSVTGSGAVAVSPTTGATVVSLASAAASTLLGVGSSAGIPAAMNFSTFLDQATGGTTIGDLLTRNNVGWGVTTPGTAGQVLTSAGAGNQLTWSTPAAAGVTSVTGSGAVSVSPTTGAAVVSLGSISAGNLLGVGASAGSPAGINFSTFVDAAIGGTAVGNLFTRNSTGWGITGPGSAGQVLTSNGVGNALTWATPSGSGTITGVTAGTNLTGGGTTGTVTLNVTGAPTFSGTVTANGTPGLSLPNNGNINLGATGVLSGNATGISLTGPGLNFDLGMNILPNANNTYNLGASGNAWNNVQAQNGIFSNSLACGTGTGGPIITVNGASGNNRGIELDSNGGYRWGIFVNNATEGGGNTGSDFAIARYQDAGQVLLDSPLVITRSTGIVAMADGWSMPVGITAALGAITIQGNSNTQFVIGGGLGAVRGGNTNVTSMGNSGYVWTAVYATNGTIQTSGVEAKDEVEDSDLGLDFITTLRPVSYRWKDGPDTHRRHHGLVAQELLEALGGRAFGGLYEPEDDVDPDTGETSPGTWGICYAELVPVLIRAIQELRAETQVALLRMGALEDEITGDVG